MNSCSSCSMCIASVGVLYCDMESVEGKQIRLVSLFIVPLLWLIKELRSCTKFTILVNLHVQLLVVLHKSQLFPCSTVIVPPFQETILRVQYFSIDYHIAFHAIYKMNSNRVPSSSVCVIDCLMEIK